MTHLAFVTTCKGRLHHLKQTLPLLVAAQPDEIVVVDYGCPDGTAAWVRENYPEVKVVVVDDDPVFSRARALNIGAEATAASWLCFIDADIRIDPSWGGWLQENLQSAHYYRAAKVGGVRNPETWGTFVCQRDAFLKAGGYDEAYRGWGGEDDDLYYRLGALAGQQESSYPDRFVDPISHGDEERTKFHAIKNREFQLDVNLYYFKVKSLLLKSPGVNLTLVARNSLMDQILEGMQQKRAGKPAGEKYRPWLKVSLDGLYDDGYKTLLEFGYRRRYVFFGPRSFHFRQSRMPA